MTDADDDETRHPWLAFAQSALGGLLLLAHGTIGGALALDLPEWPTIAYVYLIVGPHVGRFERIVGALERLLERLEKMLKAMTSFDPRRTKL